MNKTGIPISEIDVVQFEKEIGYSLPEQHRNFLLEHNGGRPKDNYHFYVPTWQYNSSLIQKLKGIDPNAPGLDLRQAHEITGDILPEGSLIIGNDPGGNSILIGLNDLNRGKIFFWDHEKGPDARLSSWEEYKNLHFLANSFNEFFALLKVDEEMDWFNE